MYLSAQSEALRHLRKPERLSLQISGFISDFAFAPTDPDGNLPDAC